MTAGDKIGGKDVWMIIDLQDGGLELPVAVFDYLIDLAAYAGLPPSHIREQMRRAKSRGTRCRYIHIILNEEEE